MNDGPSRARITVAVNNDFVRYYGLRQMTASVMDRDTEREIERVIVEDARPLVRRIVSRYTRTGTLMTIEDGEDVVATVEVRLMQKLRDAENHSIDDLRRYIAVLAYNTIHDFLRKRFPERARFKRRLRYALTRDPRFALWMTSAGAACGLAKWKDRADALDVIEPATMTDLAAIFEAAGRPVLLDALVDGMPDPDRRTDKALETIVHPADLEDRDFARAVWSEIRKLRPMQRKALLLNLRYGGALDVLSVLLLSGVARFAEIAETLELTEEQLAAMWNDLPYDDERIAKILGITRQQVINLRKAARARLSRRLPR